VKIARLSSDAEDFWARVHQLTDWDSSAEAGVEEAVREVLADVKARGDAALLEYTRRFDRLQATRVQGELEVSAERLQQALEALPAAQREALEHAAARIRAYAERQKVESWRYTEADGTLLGQQVTPLDRVGGDVPGGKAA